MMQDLPKRRRRTADDRKERAERPRTIPRSSSKHLAAGSLAGRAIR
jgi:hypothetical protein